MIAGNFEDKYNAKNPISRLLVGNFLKTLKTFLLKSGSPKKIVELGTGEGELIKIVLHYFPRSRIWGSDISKKVIRIAGKNLKNKNVSLSVENIEKLSYRSRSFDLIICCEVLEHVSNPLQALKEIRRVSRGNVILSVPLEPLWRFLNLCRGQYLKDLGNTPGHVNHFTPRELLALVQKSGFKIISKSYPLPWQMVMLERL